MSFLKLDPDTNLSQNSEVLEAKNGAVECLKWKAGGSKMEH
jgi:hypothetical protein